MSHAVPIVACNAVVLFIVLYSAWLLSKVFIYIFTKTIIFSDTSQSFIKQTFSSVGASPVINRAYKVFLIRLELVPHLTMFCSLCCALKQAWSWQRSLH